MPTFSIVIPVYNQAQYLNEAIDSALDQTVKCEVIVVNDGSTDDSLEIAKSYESRGVKVINQVNKGLPSARNTGIMNMTGEYFMPLDADDIMLENCIEKMQEEAELNHADVIAVSFKSFGVNNGTLILRGIPSLEEFKVANRIGYFSAVKKSVMLEIGGYNPKMIWGWEDHDLWLDIFKRGHSLSILNDILMCYRTKENSMITESNKHSGELWAQIRENHPTLYE